MLSHSRIGIIHGRHDLEIKADINRGMIEKVLLFISPPIAFE